MSKGLSKRQRVILELLNAGYFTTAELLKILDNRKLVPPPPVYRLPDGKEEARERMRLATVRRSCQSLLDRGLIKAEYVRHHVAEGEYFTGAYEVEWRGLNQKSSREKLDEEMANYRANRKPTA